MKFQPARSYEPIPYEGEVARTDAPSWRREPRAQAWPLAVIDSGQSVVRTAGEGCANTASPLFHEQMGTDATAAACRLGLRRLALVRAHHGQDRSGNGAGAGLYCIFPNGRASRDGAPGRPWGANREPIACPRPFPFPGGIVSALLPAADLRALARHFGAGPFIPRALRICVERHGSNSQATDQRDRQIPDLSHVPAFLTLVGFNEANHTDERKHVRGNFTQGLGNV